MQRIPLTPRDNWQQRVESVGLTFHTLENGTPYWDESAAYHFTAAEIDTLEAAGNELQEMCLAAAQHIIDEKRYAELDIPESAIEAIEWAWNNEPPALYGRFDLSWAGAQSGQPPKLLEYNADTPTSLLEAAVVQWHWLKDMPSSLVSYKPDQFNSIHERLIEAWKRWQGKTVHFSGIKGHAEDEMTVLYLRDTCEQAGVKTKSVCVEEIGWNQREQHFVDLDNERIERAFKLYPWEWLWGEEFGKHLDRDCIQFIEPAWKMLLSNKGLLPVLWELFPGHPNLLPAFDSAEPLGGRYIRKPILSREGSNVSWVEGGVVVEENGGKYGEEGFVFQSPADLPDFGGNHPVFGVWVVDHEAAGMGIREDTRRITGNLSRFVPHYFT